jgi:FHA domain
MLLAGCQGPAAFLEAMADVCRLYTVKEDGIRGEVAYDLSALFDDAALADGQRCIGVGRTQPISPVEGVPVEVAVLCSRMHAVLSLDSRGLLLRDGGGMNGTYLNDERLQLRTSMPLHGGDVISFGGGRFLQQMVGACARSLHARLGVQLFVMWATCICILG